MQFQKQGAGNFRVVRNLLVKFFLIIIVLFIVIALLNRIDFPSPNKKIEKIISNENFKIVK